MLTCVVPLEFGGNASGLCRLETFVETCKLMCVEVVGHKHNLVDFRIGLFNQDAQFFSKVDGRAPFCHAHCATALQWFNRQKEIADPLAGVLVVLALWLARCRRLTAMRCGVQFLADFIKADDRPLLVIYSS